MSFTVVSHDKASYTSVESVRSIVWLGRALVPDGGAVGYWSSCNPVCLPKMLRVNSTKF